MARNYYVVLGVTEAASLGEVQEAYRRLARTFHPDTSGADTVGRFREVQEAWDTLSDAERRRAYDEQIRRERQVAARSTFSGPIREPKGCFAGGSQVPPRPRRAEAVFPLHFRLGLEAAEAARGLHFAVEVPGILRCPYCRGTGQGYFSSCGACRGRGRVAGPRQFLVEIPPGLRGGEVLEFPLEGEGWLADRIVIHVFVE
ncbi:MAG: DnaJ domain-containing protein [Planctomycetes bacterium]|nr:DnaJ domain-containing protein [Planctomycetota bacterium]